MRLPAFFSKNVSWSRLGPIFVIIFVGEFCKICNWSGEKWNALFCLQEILKSGCVVGDFKSLLLPLIRYVFKGVSIDVMIAGHKKERNFPHFLFYWINEALLRIVELRRRPAKA